MNFLQRKPSLERGHLKTSFVGGEGKVVLAEEEENNCKDHWDDEG